VYQQHFSDCDRNNISHVIVDTHNEINTSESEELSIFSEMKGL